MTPQTDPFRRQSTLCGSASVSGVALHSGREATLTFHPAPAGIGLVFRRTDVTDRDNLIAVNPSNVSRTRNCTTLANSAGVEVSTVEHMMAALAAVGLDNVFIDVDADELPALDGSAEPFLKIVEDVGIVAQPVARQYIRVLKPVSVNIGSSHASIAPADDLILDVSIDFEDPAIGMSRIETLVDPRSFREDLAAARTFASMRDVEKMREVGLSMGGSLDNAVVVNEGEILNPEGLRWEDEFVRHKALDLLGDLYIGGPVLGRVRTHRGGHAINHALLSALFANPEAWTRDRVVPDAQIFVFPDMGSPKPGGLQSA